MATYIAYKRGEYVGEGTFEELAELTGRSVSTLQTLHSRDNPVWEITRVDYHLPKNAVDNDRILKLMEQFGYDRHSLAKALNIHYSGLNQKLTDATTWKITEVEELEDLFFLEEGELLND